MAISLVSSVQGSSGNISDTSILSTIGSIQAGNLLVVGIGWGNSSSSVSSVTDTAGNTYIHIPQASVQANGNSTAMWYAKNIAASGGNRVKVIFAPAATKLKIRCACQSLM